MEQNLTSFIDASGTFDTHDRFFGVGILTVQNKDIGELTNQLQKIFQRALAITQANKDKIIQSLLKEEKYQEVVRILKKQEHFELKYERIAPTKFSLYKEMIRIFLSNPLNRFSCMVIDRQDKQYNEVFFKTTWDAYTSYVSTITLPELMNLHDKNLYLILDEISKPKNVEGSLETILQAKIVKRHNYKYPSRPIANILGLIRIESHSNLLMQLADVLLGCTMFDFKKQTSIVSENLIRKKEEVVASLRNGLHVESLAVTQTLNNPLYFSVWKVDFNKNKNGESDKKPHPR